MKVIVVPDSFKGSMSSKQVCLHIENGIKRVLPECEVIKIPVADGGEGTVDAMLEAKGGKRIEVSVLNPLGQEIESFFGVYEDRAIIEMAAASGLTLIEKSQLNPDITTSYGTGQLIRAALDKGFKKIIIGIGGSATNDGGVGMLQALGVKFKDENGEDVGFGGREVGRVQSIDIENIDKRIAECDIVVACDVQNKFCGENGATYVYGPQKGACGEQIIELDQNLYKLAHTINRDVGINVLDINGGGAAGGLGAALVAFCKAEIKSGIDIMLYEAKLIDYLGDTDIVITGEGKIDGQSVNGKVPVGVAKIVKKIKNIPVIAVVGNIGEGAEKVYQMGIDSIMASVNKPMSLEEAMRCSPELLEDCVARMMKMIMVGKKTNHLK